MDDEALRTLAARMAGAGGVVGVTLGGSRAAGTHVEGSDTDMGVYYRAPLDVGALQAVADSVADVVPDRSARLTQPGGWGPMVDGGGWLSVGGSPVDWIYRDLDRVHASWADARVGWYEFRSQVGHPLGVPTFAYAGEIALGVVLADPSGELTALQEQTRSYPPALADALVEGLWEARFLLDGVAKPVGRGDVAYVAGCLHRVVGVCAHALCGRAGRWVVNDKGLVAVAAAQPGAPDGFAYDVADVFSCLGPGVESLEQAVEAARHLVGSVVEDACPR